MERCFRLVNPPIIVDLRDLRTVVVFVAVVVDFDFDDLLWTMMMMRDFVVAVKLMMRMTTNVHYDDDEKLLEFQQ